MKHFFAAAILVTALAACGGGGGGSVTPPTGGGTKSSATLAAGFGSSSPVASQVKARGGMTYRRLVSTADGTLGGSILPFAIFWVADSYIPSGDYPVVTGQAIAYLSGTAPQTLPTVTWSQTGDALQFVNNPTSPSYQIPAAATFLGAQNVAAPSAVGQSTVTATAASIGQSVNLTADTYGLLWLSSTSSTLYGGVGPSGLTFSATGGSPTTSGTPDLSITVGSPSSLSAPGGIIELDNTSIDQVSGSQFVSSSAQTTLPESQVCNTGVGFTSFIFKTQSGLLVKMEVAGIAGINDAPTPCTWTDIQAIYQVSNSSGQFVY